MKRNLAALKVHKSVPAAAASAEIPQERRLPVYTRVYTEDSKSTSSCEEVEDVEKANVRREDQESIKQEIDVEGSRKRVKNYAARLSAYPNKGLCGLKEVFDSEKNLRKKISRLCQLVKEAQHLVIITGAGISTSVGIPDFRGPNGVWTLEKKKTKMKIIKSGSDTGKDKDKTDTEITAFSKMDPECFDDAKPSITHEIITELHKRGIVKYLISQNVDGLHLRSGFPRNAIAELHGNLYTEKCGTCKKEYFGDRDLGGVGLKPTGGNCKETNCGGILYDTVLDWDNQLPEPEFQKSQDHCEQSDLILCLGTSLRIVPVADMPLMGEKFVVINLQRTPIDADAELVIHAKVDFVMNKLIKFLNKHQ